MEKVENQKDKTDNLISYYFDLESATELFETLHVYIKLFEQHDPMYKKVMSGSKISPAYPYTDPVTMFFGYLGLDILEKKLGKLNHNE